MAVPYYLPIITAVYLATLSITAFSAYNVYKQRTTGFRYIRNLLLGVHIFYGAIIVLEMLRTYIATQEYMTVYTIGNTSLVLADVALLTFAAITIYVRPSGTSYKDLFRQLLTFNLNNLIFILFLGYTIFVDLYLVIVRPFVIEIGQVEDILGGTPPITVFLNSYLLMLLLVLILFIAYPSTLLVLARRKVSDPSVKRALILLPIAWSGIGLELLIFNGYLLTIGIDATAFGYLIGALAFSVSATVFRRATMLVGFFESKPVTTGAPITFPFSNRLGRKTIHLKNTNFLLEVDPITNFEQLMEDFANETIGKGYTLFTFTSKGNPVYKVLANNPNFDEKIKFFILSDRVSYPKATEQEQEILVPLHNQPVLLDILDKTLKSTSTGICMIFDSVSDLILSMGFQKCYQFLKLANEIIGDSEIVSVFLITQAGHDENTMAMIKTLFANQLSFEPSGLKIIKWTQSK
jgi:hypothetical protein